MAEDPVGPAQAIQARLKSLSDKFSRTQLGTANKELGIERAEQLGEKYRRTPNLCHTPSGGDGSHAKVAADAANPKLIPTLSYDMIKGQCKELENGLAELVTLLQPVPNTKGRPVREAPPRGQPGRP